MYGTIIQTATPTGAIRQVAVVPVTGEQPRVYQRIAGGRGTGAAWIDAPLSPATLTEQTLGTPVSVAITDTDWRDIATGQPSTLLQKLVRACKGETAVSTDRLEDVLPEVIRLAIKDSGAGLSQYLPARGEYRVSVTPVVEVVKSAQPVQQAPVSSGGVLLTELSVPSAEKVADYIVRDNLPGGVSEKQVYDFARNLKQNIVIWGHAGTGKTSSAEHIASVWGVPFARVDCDITTDDEVIQGSYIPTGDPNAPLVWQYSALATAIQQPSVILLNECNRMTAKQSKLFFSILQERELKVTRHKGETIEVHPECVIIADANPGYRGTTPPDQAFLDRLSIPVWFNYDREIEAHFIPSPTLLDLATQMRAENELDDKWGAPVSTRLLKNFVTQAKGLGLGFAIESFVNSFPTDEERQALRFLFEANSQLIADELGVTA